MKEAAFSFTFDWRAAEHARVTALLIREQFSSGVGRVLRWVVVLVLVLSASLTLALVAAGDWTFVAQLGPLTLLVSVLTWRFPTLTGRIHAWRIRRADPNVGHPMTHTFDDSGFRIGMRTGSTELKWAGLNRVRETPDTFLFYYSRRTAYFLPKRLVGNSEDSAELSNWIRSRLPADVPFIS